MKIAFIVGAFPALAETFILNQITGLIDLRHEVDIYSRMTPSKGKVHPDVEKYKLYARTYYLNEVPENKIKRILKALILLPINFHKSPLTILNSLNIFKYGREALSLYFFYHVIAFLRKQYDIIHCHFGPNGNFGSTLKSIGIKGKLVVTFHAYELSNLLVREGTDIYNELFLQADLLMPISNHWKKKLIELGCSSNKIIVHHMGADTNLFKFAILNNDDLSSINILSVGRLVEKKGMEVGVRAIALILQKYPKLAIEYSIVGDGALRKHLETLIGKLGISDSVKVLGSKTQEEVKDLMARSHIFLLPSVTAQNGDQEGIPVVLMEAMASGLPVISTWHTGIPELVQDGRSGFLVPERDVDALAEKLEYLILHPEVWPKMGKVGRKFVEEHYDIKKLNQRLLKIYEGLLSGTSSYGCV